MTAKTSAMNICAASDNFFFSFIFPTLFLSFYKSILKKLLLYVYLRIYKPCYQHAPYECIAIKKWALPYCVMPIHYLNILSHCSIKVNMINIRNWTRSVPNCINLCVGGRSRISINTSKKIVMNIYYLRRC